MGESERLQLARRGNEFAADLPKQRYRGDHLNNVICLLLFRGFANVVAIDPDSRVNGVHAIRPDWGNTRTIGTTTRVRGLDRAALLNVET